MLKNIFGGILAGILISIGGTVFLSCDNKYVGAVLFSVALLCICLKGYNLFTGKVGYLAESRKKEDWSQVLTGLFGNAIATIGLGFVIAYAVPAIKNTAFTMCEAKLLQLPLQTFIRAIFCGCLMYLAVSIYRNHQKIVGIFFCIPVFILCGFEHSIADMFYFAASGIVSLKAFVFIIIVILGNSVGGLLIPILEKIGKGVKNG